MSPTALNYDILLSVLSVSPPKTATAMMETCRFLYHEGAKIVLEDPVELDGSEEKILSLLRFIQAEDRTRCVYVRTLEISTEMVPETVVKALVDLVPRMTRLRSLALEGEQMFLSFPALLPAFASLRSIKILSVFAAGERCCELITTLQSQLTSAVLCFNFNSAAIVNGDEHFAPPHPVVMLRQSASTLQELTCSDWTESDPQHLFYPPEIVYPNVHRLTLSDHYIVRHPLPYIKAFPNLTHLFVTDERTVAHGVDWPNHLPLTEALRDRSLVLQSANTWKHMQEYVGPLFDLWVLGLACPIRKLRLEDFSAARPPFALTDVLAYARPVYLAISFLNNPLTAVLASDFLNALRSTAVSGLESVFFAFNLTAEDRELDVGDALDDLGNALLGVPFFEFGLIVSDVGLQPETEPESGPSDAAGDQSADTTTSTIPDSSPNAQSPSIDARPVSLNLAERTLADTDVLAFVHALVHSFPALRKACVIIGQPRRCGGRSRVGELAEDKENPGQKVLLYSELDPL